MKKRWKILIGVLVVLVVAVGVLWIVGGRTYHYQASIKIEATPKRIFPYLTEPELLKRWMDGVVEVKPLTEDGHKAGAKALVVIEEDGDRFEMESEVTETVEGELLTVKITSSMFLIENSYELTQEDRETTIVQSMKADYLGFARTFAPFAGSAIYKKLDADLERLRNILETPVGEEPE